jgi:hypothetical protein
MFLGIRIVKEGSRTLSKSICSKSLGEKHMSIFSKQTKSQKFAKNAQSYGTAVLTVWFVSKGVDAINGLINAVGKSIASGAASLKDKQESAKLAAEAQANATTAASALAQEAPCDHQEAPATPAG